jgi:hypothetical protein
MKQETLKEAAEKQHNYTSYEAFIRGAKWQQEQDKKLYSEEEVLEFTQTMIQQYKFGNTNIEQMDLLKESLEQFKKK